MVYCLKRDQVLFFSLVTLVTWSASVGGGGAEGGVIQGTHAKKKSLFSDTSNSG